ncbi:threonine/serine exporter ThrE family protein [Eubacteriales bacterium KG127]
MDYERILQCILDIGEEMLVCGAEVSRVEDSIFRMCKGYGCDRINVFIITNNMQVTFEAPDGKIITQIRTVLRYNPNYSMLDKLNNLSREAVSTSPSYFKLSRAFDKIVTAKYQPRFFKYIGGILVCGGFCMFFGGDFVDSIAASIGAIIIVFTERYLNTREDNEFVYYYIVSLITALASILLMKIGIGHNIDKILIGEIMLVIPGVAMTNSIRDLLMGDTGSGLIRFINSVLIAGIIASGFATALIIFGG